MNRKWFASVVGVILSTPLFALTLSVKDANLPDVLQQYAKFTHQNVVISPGVQGRITLQIANANAQSVLHMLLQSQGLGTWREAGLMYIAPVADLQTQQNQANKWRDLQNDSQPIMAKSWRLRYASANEIAKLLQTSNDSLLSKQGTVRFDTRTNQLFLADHAPYLHRVQQLIQQLDIPRQQLQIEARLVSVDSDYEQALGVSLAAGDASNSAQSLGRYSVALIKLANTHVIDVAVSALENAGHASFIAKPTLFTADAETAAIEAGEQVPYLATSEGGGTATVFKKAVLSLEVTPHILPGNVVNLSLKINQDRPSAHNIQGVPAISTRQITTHVAIQSGATVVLGGIYESSQDQNQQAIPFISHVPVVGWLFKQQNMHRSKRELLIFVTPRIIV